MPKEQEPYILSEDTSLLCILELDAELKKNASDFLLYGGILAGHSDGHFTLEELAFLSESLSSLFDNPDPLLKGMLSPDMAMFSFEKSTAWLCENGGQVKHNLLRCLAALVATDHLLRPEELRFVQNTSRRLGIPSDEGRQIMREALLAKTAELRRKQNKFRNTIPLYGMPRSAQAKPLMVSF